MSARSTFVHVTARAGIMFGALFLVSVLLAAIPGHRAPAVAVEDRQTQAGSPPSSSQAEGSQRLDHGKMSAIVPDDAKADQAHAIHDMTPGSMDAHNLHMHMTAMRPTSPEDTVRAHEIVSELRSGIAKYKDYHVALDEGYRIFLPNVPQPEYHFTKYVNGFLDAFSFDPSRPASLLYKKTSDGYELVGAMYTMPKRATEDQLNARVPLSVAMWHLHTNLCMPPRNQRGSADMTKFGLQGTIVTEQACDASGGRFQPVIFGWMVHVYPYQDSLDKIFAMHQHTD